MSLIFLAGTPAHTSPDPIWVPLVTTAPAANGVTLHYTPIQDDGSHTNKYIVLKGTAVYDGIVPYRDIVADSGRGFLIGTMYHHIVLYIYLIADDNSIHIAPKDGIVPYTTILSEGNLANKDSCFGYKYVLSYNRGFSPNFSDDRHKIVL